MICKILRTKIFYQNSIIMKAIISMAILLASFSFSFSQDQKGLQGDPSAIADAKAMVETMGGSTIWSQIKSLHFVHQWYPCDRIDTYVENETLDLTTPSSHVDRKSEISHTVRAYSVDNKYWTIANGKFEYGSEQAWKSSVARAPFNFYHLVRAVAVNDPGFRIQYGKSDVPNATRLDFFDSNGALGGWVILNAKKEPIVKATPEYRYTLGPLKRFGNLYVPSWGVYDTGYTRYEMISLTGDNQPPNPDLFIPPPEYLKK